MKIKCVKGNNNNLGVQTMSSFLSKGGVLYNACLPILSPKLERWVLIKINVAIYIYLLVLSGKSIVRVASFLIELKGRLF